MIEDNVSTSEGDVRDKTADNTIRAKMNYISKFCNPNSNIQIIFRHEGRNEHGATSLSETCEYNFANLEEYVKKEKKFLENIANITFHFPPKAFYFTIRV